MNWTRLRRWRYVAAPFAVAAAYGLLNMWPEGSAAWYAGIAIAGVLGLAYVIEEVVWNWQGAGRPCTHCGHRVSMKSFSVSNTCPRCGKQL